MALVDDIKVSLRVSTDAMDAEVEMLIGAALYDMERAGVNPALLEIDDEGCISNKFVKTAVTSYCKANFGYDVSEAARFSDTYYRIVCDLLNSSENIAAKEVADGLEEAQDVAAEPPVVADPEDGRE